MGRVIVITGTEMNRFKLFASILTAGLVAVFLGAQEQDPVNLENHSDCSFFSTEREKYARETRDRYWRSRLTEEVSYLSRQALVPGGTRTRQLQDQVSISPSTQNSKSATSARRRKPTTLNLLVGSRLISLVASPPTTP
jgi:hypothetical protein